MTASDSEARELIRPAGVTDLDAILEIQNFYAEHTHHVFDADALSKGALREWFDQFATTGPHRLLVAESKGSILGYASSRTFHPRPVYAQTVETGIYINPDRRSEGQGTRLYQALLELLLNEANVHRIVASITLPNPASLKLHSKLGFREVGTFPDIGYKDDKRYSLRWMIRSARTEDSDV